MIVYPKNFPKSEFVCHCGADHDFDMDFSLLCLLQNLRNACGFALKINRGFSCPEWNQKINGAEFSQHLYGKGVDIHCVSNIKRATIIKHALNLGFTFIRVYKTHIHLDNRATKIQKLEFDF